MNSTLGEKGIWKPMRCMICIFDLQKDLKTIKSMWTVWGVPCDIFIERPKLSKCKHNLL